MNFELISIIVVYSLLFFIIYKNRKKMQIMDKIFFVFKWDKGVDLIKKLSSKHLKWVYTLGIPVCIFLMFYSIKIMWDGAMMILSSPNPEPTVSLLIPGVKIPGSPVYVPFWYGIISMVIIIFVHELSHGIAATIEKIKLKSTGIGMLLVLPVAFVEPEQESYEKSKRISKIRMLIAGSLANLIVAILAVLIINFAILPWINSMVNYEGVMITELVEDGPAMSAGVMENSRILSINNRSVHNMTDFYAELSALSPNSTALLATNISSNEVLLSTNPSNESLAYLGVMVEQEWQFKKELSSVPFFLLNIPLILATLLMWVSNLNLGISVINLFPLWITDGGKVLIEIIRPLIKDDKKTAAIINTIFMICLSLLLFNLFGAYMINAINILI
jgi:membrane-associated protease RseP (regulator of RpoE activity)